ncbi:transglutaminase-like putative cysteine protease [Natronospira proteinivora]|uniref:Transglutaminase-like putative cysteine protease n=1 Tax=Natronospira proteinivora TaxID=1807133 RepID=A0ABT1GB44_9GAMM|nr:transglutaminase family protein [Natronospira proteinivora]MCP1727117.1 transglutaminase-like putative cysteine protease [Natronospira proteinivora]
MGDQGHFATSPWRTGTVRLEARFDMRFQVEQATPMLMVLRPRIDVRQWIMKDHFFIHPDVPVSEYVDDHGNRCQRLTLPPGPCQLSGSLEASVAAEMPVDRSAGFVPIQALPDEVIHYLLPSRYCESDRLGELAREIVSDSEPGYAQVERICQWLSRQVAYRPGSSNTLVTAREVLDRGEGVCRDLAHLGVALCRALSIPARFVSGYLQDLDPMDLHAWFEAWLDNGWQGFDPTQAGRKGGRIILAVGRDGADVPIYNQFGPLLIPQVLVFSVKRLDG